MSKPRYFEIVSPYDEDDLDEVDLRRLFENAGRYPYCREVFPAAGPWRWVRRIPSKVDVVIPGQILWMAGADGVADWECVVNNPPPEEHDAKEEDKP